MSPEDRKKQELIIQNRKEIAEKKKAERAYRQQMEDYSRKDRIAKGQEQVKDSVPQKRVGFGQGGFVKFEAPQGGGG